MSDYDKIAGIDLLEKDHNANAKVNKWQVSLLCREQRRMDRQVTATEICSDNERY
jgi:hypothetical protein